MLVKYKWHRTAKLYGIGNVFFMPRTTLIVWCSTEWPKKVSHYQVSSLNRIKTVIKGKNFL